MDRLRSMEIFVEVVDCGSFSAAGRALGLAPATVTKHIAELEARVGARLLQRSTRKLALTEIGSVYCEQCRQILALVAVTDAGAESMLANVRGSLRISAPAAFGSECLAPALADYLARYPDVNVELDLSNRVADLVDEGLDAVVRIGPLNDSSLVARPLAPYGMAICAAPEYLRRRGTPLTLADLAGHDCLNLMHWQHEARWRLEPTSKNAAPTARLRSNNGQALRRAAVAGLGIVMLAEIVLAEDIAAGKLVPILRDYWPPARPMHLIYPRDRQRTRKLATFVDFVLERFGLNRGAAD